MMIVVDTSALLRLYIPDGPMPENLEVSLREAERGNDVIMAPELILAEAGQVLLKKHEQGILSLEEMRELLNEILSLPIRLFGHQPLLLRASELAREYSLTVYDALFLALAEQHSARLISADSTLEKAARKMRLI